MDIANGLFVTFIGLSAVLIALFRLKRKDFSLLNFGVFLVICGLRWLFQTATVRSLAGIGSDIPYFPFTYLMVIPLAAFLVDIFGAGFYNLMRWVFRILLLCAVIAIVGISTMDWCNRLMPYHVS